MSELYVLRHKKYKNYYLYWWAGEATTTTELLHAASLNRCDLEKKLEEELELNKKYGEHIRLATVAILEEMVIDGVKGTFCFEAPMYARDFEIATFREVEE